MNTILPPGDGDRFVLTAAEVVNRKLARGDIPRGAPPHNVILCFDRSLVDHAVRERRVKKVDGFLGDLCLLNESHGRTAIAGNFGIGAPVAVALMEELVAYGADRFVAIGLAGGLQSELRAGDLIVCERALREEGASRHYAPPSRFAEANVQITRALCRALESQKQTFSIGESWTTDAPYRETLRQVEQYRREGIETVEMEAAALFAAGHALGIQVGAAFSIADSLDGDKWRLDFDQRRAQRGLQILLDAAVRTFSEVP